MSNLNPQQFGPYAHAHEPIPDIDISNMPRYTPGPRKIGARNAVKLSRAIKGSGK